REYPLGRNMIITTTHEIQNFRFARCRRRHGDMTALALEQYDAALRVEKCTHTQTCAGANHADGRVDDARTRADLDNIALTKFRYGEGVGSKIVDDVKFA